MATYRGRDMKNILAWVVTVAIFLGPVIWILYFIRNPYRALHTDKPTAALGSALQVLDRVIRPSIEHATEVDDEAGLRDDDEIGGE